MRVLTTFPGRFGDIIWALPAIRAVSRRIGAPVDLQIAGEFASLVPLLQQQPYIGAVTADPGWSLTPPEEWRAPQLQPLPHAVVLHLGYRGWPARALPLETLHTLQQEWRRVYFTAPAPFTEADLDLSTPWITLNATPRWALRDLAIAFSETHFELKYGLVRLLWNALPNHTGRLLCLPRSRWAQEGLPSELPCITGEWLTYARGFAAARVALCCNSGAHVLAVAMGVPVVMMEPIEARHNPIFYPCGTTGPQVTLVRGNDGAPTFDCRHVAETLTAALARQKAQG